MKKTFFIILIFSSNLYCAQKNDEVFVVDDFTEVIDHALLEQKINEALNKKLAKLKSVNEAFKKQLQDQKITQDQYRARLNELRQSQEQILTSFRELKSDVSRLQARLVALEERNARVQDTNPDCFAPVWGKIKNFFKDI